MEYDVMSTMLPIQFPEVRNIGESNLEDNNMNFSLHDK